MVKVGLIGCGSISNAHAGGYAAHADIGHVVAVAEIGEERRRAWLTQWRDPLGVERDYDDYHALLERPDIDAVDICLPHHLHARVVGEALEAGKHVFVEKPLALTTDEARHLVGRAKGRILMVGHSQRFDPLNLAFRDALLDMGGALHLAYTNFYDIPLAQRQWYADKSIAGGGIVMGAGIHYLDLARWCGGEIKAVCCRTGILYRSDFNCEDTGLILLEFANGALGTIRVSYAYVNEPRSKFEGEALTPQGTILFKDRELRINRKGEDGVFGRSLREISAATIFEREIGHFLECIIENKPPLTDGHEGLKAVELVEACYRSAETGCRVEL